jgi:hypothetical protein
MSNIKLNNEINIDLTKLIDSKLLVQANSGGGKSWAIRRILEQSHGKVQHIVLDPEGEFGTLREKYDYILCGKGGDVPADPRSAAMLAHKLLEYKASAIIDLYELHPQDRKRYVRLFLESLVNAPKELWNPCLVVIDEAHTFVPEKGESEAANAVIGLASLGRKRGFCAILATQRISKLHKDAAAECNNKLIGRTGLDIDRKRASEELGFTSKEQNLSLRTLEPGEFFSFGPAISNDVIKLRIGDIQTTHPKAGSRTLTEVAPPREGIKKILAKLADLPAEAKKEAVTVSELKEQIRSLTRENGQLKRQPNVTNSKDVEKSVKTALIANDRKWQVEVDEIKKVHAQNVRFVEACKKNFSKIAEIASGFKDVEQPKISIRTIPMRYSTTDKRPVERELMISNIKLPSQSEIDTHFSRESSPSENKAMGAGEKTVLIAIAQQPEGMTREHITVETGYKRSTRDAYIQRLFQKGYVGVGTGKIRATDEGIEALGHDYEQLPQGQDLIEYHLKNLPEGEAKIFRLLVEAYENNVDGVMNRDDITQVTGYQRSTRDAYIQRLTARQLVVSEAHGMVRASPLLFQL